MPERADFGIEVRRLRTDATRCRRALDVGIEAAAQGAAKAAADVTLPLLLVVVALFGGAAVWHARRSRTRA